jgi:hypothetical protein
MGDLNSLVSTLMFFLSGAKVSDTQINKSIIKEQILQLDPEMHWILSGKNRYCNCNLIGLSIPVGSREARINELKYYPGRCSGESFPILTKDVSWKGLMVKDITLSRVVKFTDGYIGDLTVALKSPPPGSETYLKKYPIIFNGKEDSDRIVYSCDPLISQVSAGREEVCMILDGSQMKCMGFTGNQVVGDEPSEVGDGLPKVPFTEGELSGMFHAGKSPEEVFCIQLKSGETECRNALQNRAYPLNGNPGGKRIRELVLNQTIKSDVRYENIEKFGAMPGSTIDLSEINRTPVGEYLNRENTFLALYEDGTLGVLSAEDKHQPLYLPVDVTAKKIISYNISSACILSLTDEVYCWGLLGGVMTTNPITFSPPQPDPSVMISLFVTPIKIPVTANRAQWMKKVEFRGGARVRQVKSQFHSSGLLALPTICATLDSDIFTCFPQVLNDEQTQIGQMTEFPEVGKGIESSVVKDFWLWAHPFASTQRDPLPIVLLENNDLVFASGGGFVNKWSLKNVNSYEVVDVKADNTTVNVLFQDGQLLAFPAADNFAGSPFVKDDFNQPSLDSDEHHFKYDFGGPVREFFIQASSPNISGALCALMEKGEMKCSGTHWGYGDKTSRLNKDPELRGKKFPEIDVGKI